MDSEEEAELLAPEAPCGVGQERLITPVDQVKAGELVGSTDTPGAGKKDQ